MSQARESIREQAERTAAEIRAITRTQEQLRARKKFLDVQLRLLAIRMHRENAA